MGRWLMVNAFYIHIFKKGFMKITINKEFEQEFLSFKENMLYCFTKDKRGLNFIEYEYKTNFNSLGIHIKRLKGFKEFLKKNEFKFKEVALI